MVILQDFQKRLLEFLKHLLHSAWFLPIEEIIYDLKKVLSQQAIVATSESMVQFVQDLSPNVTPKNDAQFLLNDREDARRFQLKYGMDGKNDELIKKVIIKTLIGEKEVRMRITILFFN